MKRLAVIRFWYEGNAFSPVLSTRESFQAREWLSGPTAKDFYQDTNIELAAVEEFIRINPGVEAHYIFCAAAYPAGPMEAGLFLQILKHIEAGLGNQQWHGVYLSLHGSAVTEDAAQPETELIKCVRKVVGTSLPVAATFDLHANLNPELADLLNIVCGYKTYPHVDMFETAAKALTLLGKTMAGEIKPVTTIVPAAFAPTSFNMRTNRGPMADVLAHAGKIEQECGFFDVSVFGGFVYADTIDTGASISICANDSAFLEATGLARFIRVRAPLFDIKLPTAHKTLSELNDALEHGNDNLPIAILEPSDNIFSGGAADTPGLLATILQSKIPAPSLFAFFWDPKLVQQANRTGVGNRFTAHIGARLTSAFGPPVDVSVQITKLTDGQFENFGPMEKNLKVDLGPTAVLKINQLSIIVTTNKIPVNDRAYFDLHGINPGEFAIVYVKAKNHFRSAFEDMFSQIIEVETPGPAASDLDSFHFKNIPSQFLNSQIQIRKARLQDTNFIANIHTSSWRDVYKNILPANYLAYEIEQERLDFWHSKLSTIDPSEMVLTINSGDVVLGFIWVTRTGEPGYDAVIEALHIDIDARYCGYGKLIIKAAVQRLIKEGVNSICLRVFDDNAPAIRFYHQIGGIKDQSGVDNFTGANAADSRIGWKDIRCLLNNL